MNCPFRVAKSSENKATCLHLFFVDLQSEIDAACSVLSAAEMLKSNSFVRAEDALRYQRRHLALRGILGRHCGVPAAELLFVAGPHGKPTLAHDTMGAPHFSLSSSHRWALICLSDSRACGVDIELIDTEDLESALVNHACTKTEREFLATLSRPEKSLGFYQLWTRKEALLKAWGCGLSLEPNQIDVLRDLNLDAYGNLWRLQNIVCPEGYCGAVAAVGSQTLPNFPIAYNPSSSQSRSRVTA